MTDDVPAALVSVIRDSLSAVPLRYDQSFEEWRKDRARNIAQAIIGIFDIELTEETDPIRVVARRAGT